MVQKATYTALAKGWELKLKLLVNPLSALKGEAFSCRHRALRALSYSTRSYVTLCRSLRVNMRRSRKGEERGRRKSWEARLDMSELLKRKLEEVERGIEVVRRKLDELGAFPKRSISGRPLGV